MSADALSDVLRSVRLTGAVFFDVIAEAPWAAEQPAREAVLGHILPGAQHLISYHVVTEGSCYGALVGGDAVPLAAGDIIVFTQGDPHVMSSNPGLRAVPMSPAELATAASAQLPFALRLGQGGPPTTVVCGFLACDARPFNPLLDNLPRLLKMRDGDGGGWLGQFVRLARMESASRRAGGESVLAKLSELMFIEVVRRYLDALPQGQTGWLAGLRDPFVGKALSHLHARPAHGWTIETLAREVGLSRSVLAERFTQLVGVPPMHYLARWRMQVAASLLNAGNANLASVAVEAGYASEAAFSRAFKKLVGVSPSAWRRGAAAA